MELVRAVSSNIVVEVALFTLHVSYLGFDARGSVPSRDYSSLESVFLNDSRSSSAFS